MLDEAFTLMYYGSGMSFTDIAGRPMTRGEREYFIKKVEEARKDETSRILDVIKNLKL